MVYLYKFDMSYDSVRERIFVLLKEQKLTQKELAERLEISPQTVTDWKKKKSNSFMEMLGKLSTVLQTSPAWLCGGIGQKHMTDQEKVKKDDPILQAIEAYDAQLEQDSTLAMKAAFQHIQDLGLWSEMKSKYPDLYDYAKELLGEKTEPTVQDDGLSEAEQALMDLFRQLTPDQQDMVIRIVQAAADKM